MSFCDALTVMLQLCFSIDKFRFLSELVLNGCLPPEYKIELVNIEQHLLFVNTKRKYTY